MTRTKHTLLALATAAALLGSAAMPYGMSAKAVVETPAVSLPDSDAYVQGEAIVLYRGTTERTGSTFSAQLRSQVEVVDSYTFDTQDDQNLSIQAQGVNVPDQGFMVSLVRSDEMTTAELIASLSARSDVLAVEPNYRLQAQSYDSDPYAAYQWALDNTGQNGGTVGLDLNADDPNITLSPDAGEQVIAIVDTGIDYTHPDLVDRMWVNPYQDTGLLNGTYGYDFVYSDDDPMDENGHGTHCAGIAAAGTGDGVGIAGTAGENVRLMALRILDENGTGLMYGEIGAYHYIYQAQKMGVNVVAINNSWGYGAISDPEEIAETQESYGNIMQTMVDLVGENGALSLMAAGNESRDSTVYATFPACLESPYLLSVAATDEQDRLTNFSNYGYDVDVAAPGVNILSTVCYPSFQPLLMTEEERSVKLSYYEDFSAVTPVMTATGTTVMLAEDDATIGYTLDTTDEAAEMTVTRDTTQYHENVSDTAASLHWSIPNATVGNTYTLYLPIAASELESAMYKAEIMTYSDIPVRIADLSEEESASSIDVSLYPAESGEVMIYDGLYQAGYSIDQGYSAWDPYESEDLASLYGDMVVVGIQITCEIDANYDIYLDNVAISDPSVPQEELTVPYDFYSGTSMATSYVTGAAALLAGMYPEMGAIERALLLQGCTRYAETMDGLVASNGVLDLSYLTSPKPVVTETWLDSMLGVLLVHGGGLDQATITLNGEPVAYTQQENGWIEIDLAGYENQHVWLCIEGEGLYYESGFYYATGISPERYYANDTELMLESGDQILNIDDTLYLCTYYGDVYCYDMESHLWISWNENSISESLLNGVVPCTPIISGYSVVDGMIYAAVSWNFGYSVEGSLMVFDPESMVWTTCCDLPAELLFCEDMLVTGYQGEVYFLGGYDNNAEAHSDGVMSYDPATDEWITHASLPETVFGGRVTVVGDLLTVTLASTENGISADLWQYDGSAWSITEQALPGVSDLAMTENAKPLTAVSVYEDTLVYTGLPTDGLGDMLLYDMGDGAVTGMEYTTYDLSADRIFQTAVVGDVLYVFYNTGVCLEAALIPLKGELPPEEVFGDPEETDPEDPAVTTTATTEDPETTTTTTTTSAVEGTDEPSLMVMLGDVNFDEVVGIDDAYAALRYYAQQAAGLSDNYLTDGTDPGAEEAALLAADVDGDDAITIQDAYYILQYYANQAAGLDVTWESLVAAG